MRKLLRTGFDYTDIVTLVIGSHSMGGIHRGISPDLFNDIDDPQVTFIPFDTTPGVFDNDVFKRVFEGYCPVPFDCQVASDEQMRPIVERFASDQTAFFEQYAKSFQKMTLFTGTGGNLSQEMLPDIPVHKNLLKEGSMLLYGRSTATSNHAVRGQTSTGLWLIFLIICILK